MAKATATNKNAPVSTQVQPDGVPKNITKVEVRMYCLGTGDCFVLKFYAGEVHKYTMMVDCGSCQGDAKDFEPYLQDLKSWVDNKVDLLVVTHEHNDHVNGFAKCPEIFNDMKIGQAWFGWTENPKDPFGRAQDLLKKRERMRLGFENALKKVEENKSVIEKELAQDFNNKAALSATNAFLDGLNTLGEINLADSSGGKPLPGMVKIKELLKEAKIPVKYPYPGDTISIPALPGVKFHVLGPPLDKKYIYKNAKEGKDVYKRHFSIGEGILAMNTFADLGKPITEVDLPFGKEYIVDEATLAPADIGAAPEHVRKGLKDTATLIEQYRSDKWRSIEQEWLYAAGSLAIRLNSHINNTSLVLAIEFGEGGKVVLLPGDAEFGSWESWHMIDKWTDQGKGGKHLVEDLLNRTVFYKVSHHLSYNGTALEKGIMMMNNPELAAMATLDRNRISTKWKSTMPNKQLLKELIKRCQGKCFIMDESEIQNPPSDELDPASLDNIYREQIDSNGKLLYKQYTVMTV